MFYPDCTYADMNSNKCKEGFIVLWTGLKNKQTTAKKTQPPNSKSTQKFCFYFVELIFPCCP